MALGFIKKVFTFGKEKPSETTADTEADVRRPEDATPEAGAPERPDEVAGEQVVLADLPEIVEPVPPEETTVADGSALNEPDTNTDAESLPSAPSEHLPHQRGERENAAPAFSTDSGEESVDDSVVDKPSANETFEPLQIGASHSGDVTTPTPDVEQDTPVQPITPTEGEMSGRTEGGAERHNRSEESSNTAETPDRNEGSEQTAAHPTDLSLPKGFAAPADEPAQELTTSAPRLNWFQRLRAGLFRTSSQLSGQIAALFTKRKLDEETLQDLEDLLIQSDLGVETAMRITDTLSSERYGKDVTGEDVARIMASEITKVLKPVAKPLELDLSHKPHVILVVGVNGTGKTTTIGKLAAKLTGAGLKVMLAAGDTFRAAAIEQLKIWADRTGSTFVGTRLGADAAGLAYDAFERAQAEKSDVLIIDTAGRLQNKAELMAELEKIVRVLGKLDPEAPHTVLQTLDATTGQNALSQVEIFRNVAGVSGLIMTKLDGTARGGILVGIAAKHKLPVYFIGVGEGIDDLEPFEAEDFARAIAGLAH